MKERRKGGQGGEKRKKAEERRRNGEERRKSKGSSLARLKEVLRTDHAKKLLNLTAGKITSHI